MSSECQMFEQVITAIPSLLIQVDPDRRVRWWNRTAERILGVRAESVVDKALFECELPWDETALSTALDDCANTRRPVRMDDMGYQRSDGEKITLGITVYPIDNPDGGVVGYLLFGADITQRRQMENQLAQTEKLQAIGQLSGGIAHEINTPAQYIGDNVYFLKDAFEDVGGLLDRVAQLLDHINTGAETEFLRREVEDIEQFIEEVDLEFLRERVPESIDHSLAGIERISKIVRAMKDFARPGSESKSLENLHEALDNLIIVTTNQWASIAEVECRFAPDVPKVPCYMGELNQVFLNLMLNACYAVEKKQASGTGEKGTIRIQTQLDDGMVQIDIADTGIGIPKTNRDKVFEPFFTTKEVGQGTGQGLTMAHDIVVRRHRGTIALASAEGKGTTLTVRLPLS